MNIYIFLFNSLFSLIATTAGSSYCVDSEKDEEEEVLSTQQQSSQEEAPSTSPSMNLLACVSHTSNARGWYTSTLAPCTFHFHKVDPATNELDLINFHTSDLCSTENSFVSMKEYVSEWPDECVGDFQRCYSLEHHRSVVWNFLCSKDWSVPEDTTHMSVDCHQDKGLVRTAQRREEQSKAKMEFKTHRVAYETKLYNLAMILGACLVSVFALSNLIIKPLILLKRSSACQDVLPQSNNMETQEVTNQSRLTSLSQQEEMIQDFDSQVPADFDAVPIAPATMSSRESTSTNVSFYLQRDSVIYSTSEVTEEQGSRNNDPMNDSESQVPVDVDAIPIAPVSTISSWSTGGSRHVLPTSDSEVIEDTSYITAPMNDLHSQITTDYDDIPIVSATILHS